MKYVNKKYISIIFYFVLLFLLVFTISEKKNYHVDETLTFSLANHVGYRGVIFEEGQIYDASEVFSNLFAVNDGERFNFRNVWDNQANNVHPPLYYALINMVFSIFPGRYTRWFPGIINIAFSLLTLFALRKLVAFLSEDNDKITNLISVVFCLSAGTLSMATFFRMYVMAMFFVTMFSYVFFKGIADDFKLSNIVSVFITALLGVLTHYYVAVFMVFLCICGGIYLIIAKKWKSLLIAVITMLSAAGLSILIFPSMLTHMFTSSNTGSRSVTNLLGSFGEWGDRIKIFFSIFDNFWFGGILFLWILFFALMGITKKFALKEQFVPEETGEEKWQKQSYFIMLCIAIICYFLIISKIALALVDRYLAPIYAVGLAVLILGLWKSIRFISDYRLKVVILIMISSIIIFTGWKTNGWEYLYNDEEEMLDIARQETSGKDCLYICDSDQGSWKINANWTDLSNVSTISFVSVEHMDKMDELNINDKYDLVLYVMDDDSERIADEVKGRYGYATCRYLYSRGYADAYILSRYEEDERDYFTKNE